MKPGRSSVSASCRIDDRHAADQPRQRARAHGQAAVGAQRRCCARTTTVPRSTGPTLPGSDDRQPGEAAVGRAGERDGAVERRPARRRCRPSALTEPTRDSAGQVPASAFASGQTGTPLRLPARPGGSSRRDPREVLRAVRPRDLERHRAGRAPGGGRVGATAAQR